MSRITASIEGQAAQPAGPPAGLTFNGYFAALVAGAAANYKMRRCGIGVRAGAGVPTSQQLTVAIYRQSVRAVGTGLANVAGQNQDPRGVADPTSGIDYPTAAAAGTTGPTVGANALVKLPSFNSQSGYDIPWEQLDELICDQGTANGLAFVNIGNALPPGHFYTLGLEWEI